jgi:hypothetical protein
MVAVGVLVSANAAASESGLAKADDRLAFLAYQEQLSHLIAEARVVSGAGDQRAAVSDPAPEAENPAASCLLVQPGKEGAPAETCIACHGEKTRTHPVDIAYPVAQAGSSLRDQQEVVKRGVFLPDGTIRCATCHDARSPWRGHLAIPAGAEVHAAVNPRDPSSYRSREAPPRAGGPSLPRSMNAAGARSGAAVTTTPLCQACHTMGD